MSGETEKGVMSANGYTLTIEHGGEVFEERASWPAPYFSLVLTYGPDGPDEPLLIHCETLEDARRKGGIVLDAGFQKV